MENRLNRLPDWRDRLAATVARLQGQYFCWRDCHCGHLVRDIILAVTGFDCMSERDYRYESESDYRGSDDAELDADAEEMLTSYGMQRIDPMRSEDGDIVNWSYNGGGGLGIMLSGRVYVRLPAGSMGLRPLPRSVIKKAFSYNY